MRKAAWLGVILLAAGWPARPAAEAGDPDRPGWVQIDTRESASGPVLELVLKDGTTVRLSPEEDTGVLAYLPTGGLGTRKSLALDENAWNRILVRFDLAGLGEVTSAHLVLTWRQSNVPIAAPLEIGLHRLRKTFHEGTTTFATLPAFDRPADVKFKLDPAKVKPVRVDVGAAVQLELKTKGTFHGWLLMSTTPRAVPPHLLAPKTTGGGPKPAAQPASPLAREWFKVHSRSMADGPVLKLTHEDGTTEERAAEADTMAISYIPEGNWAHKATLSLDRGGRTRLYLRFDLDGLEKVKSAKLVFVASKSGIPLTRPIEVGAYEVESAWQEAGLTWNDQPAVAEKALVTFEVAAALGAVTVDVTDAVRRGAGKAAGKRHGWLLRAASAKTPTPLPTAPATPPARARPGAALLQEILGLVTWEADAAAAVKKAKEEKKLALALVRASYNPTAPNDNEETFLAASFAHPAIHRAVQHDFVPTRIWYHGMVYAMDQRPRNDPLAPLGTSAGQTKPLALVVSDGDGKHLGTLDGLGTFSPAIVGAFLVECVRRAKGKRPRHALDPEEARRFTDGVEALEIRDPAAAQEIWSGLSKESPWRYLVRAYAAWPERMAMYAPAHLYEARRFADFGGTQEDGDPLRLAVRVPAKEIPKLALHAAERLLRRQHEDGSWRTAQPYDAYWAGVTALCMRALEAWQPHLDLPRRMRIDEAREKALAWFDGWMKAKGPEAANSFGTAYLVDLYLDLLERDKKYKRAAQRAVTFHERGQAPNGGWGYDRGFAVRWRGGFGGWPVTDKGRVHSINTAPSLLPLARAKAMGLRVDADVLAKGVKCLLAMKDGPAVFTYTYPEPRNFNKLDTSIGRACCCEEALLALGKGDPKHLEKAVATFLEHRTDLRRMAKVSPGWTPPRAVSSYFYFFAYHHAARAIRALPEAQRKKRLEALRDDLLACVEPDGTWVDFLGVGKPYGTAMALLILRWAQE